MPDHEPRPITTHRRVPTQTHSPESDRSPADEDRPRPPRTTSHDRSTDASLDPTATPTSKNPHKKVTKKSPKSLKKRRVRGRAALERARAEGRCRVATRRDATRSRRRAARRETCRDFFVLSRRLPCVAWPVDRPLTAASSRWPSIRRPDRGLRASPRIARRDADDATRVDEARESADAEFGGGIIE